MNLSKKETHRSGTYYLPLEVYAKLKEIAYRERSSMTNFIEGVMCDYIRKYEEANGTIPCEPINRPYKTEA